MRYFSRFYKGRQDTITILNRNPLNLYRGPTPLSQHQTIEGAVRAAYRDARQNGNATYRVRVDGGNYVRFSITLPDRGAIQASTQVGLDVALVLGAPWQPPVVSSTPTPSFTEGTPGTYEFEANITRTGLPVGFDYPITYTLNGTVDPSLSLAAATGVLTYDGSAGTTYALTLTVTDAQGADTSDSFDMTIVAIDTAPTVSTPSFAAFTEGVFGQTRDLSVYVTDDGQSPVVYSITGALPGGVTLDSATGILSYNGIALADTRSVTFTATDDVGSDTSSSFNITISQAAVGAEADWAARIAQPGVVWYHNFASDAEVDQFRRGGSGDDPGDLTDPGMCIRITTDGVTGGGCLQNFKPALRDSIDWWRPMDPLDGIGNGRGIPDPGAELITPRAWRPTQNGNENTNWDTGYYGHQDHDQGKFDGNEWYLQVRMKMDPRRITGGNESFSVGKNIWTTLMRGQTLTGQETVIWSYGHNGNLGSGKNYFRVYALGAAGGFNPLDQAANPYDGIQPGSEVADDWYWSGGWDTVLIHQRPGKAGVSSGPDQELLEVWAAHEGETEYTKIWSQQFTRSNYEGLEGDGRWGMQGLLLSTYNNESTQNLPQDFWHRYDEVIWSKEPIVLPQPTPTNLEIRQREMVDGDYFASGSGSPVIPNAPRDVADSYTWQINSGWADPIRRRIHVIGEHYEGNSPYEHHYWDDANNTWVTSDITAIYQGPSHWRGQTWDNSTGRMFHRREASSDVFWYDPVADQWYSHSTDARFTEQEGSYPYSIGFHPNLFGAGKPGLVAGLFAHTLVFEFTDYLQDPTAGSWQSVAQWDSPSNRRAIGRAGCSMYLPGADELIFFGDPGAYSTVHTAVFAAGFGNIATVTPSDIPLRTQAPVPIVGNSGNNKGYLCIHPRKRDRLLLLNAANGAVWYSDDGAVTWPTAAYTHPFADNLNSGGLMSITPVSYLDLVMGITHRDAVAGESRVGFWKPPL